MLDPIQIENYLLTESKHFFIELTSSLQAYFTSIGSVNVYIHSWFSLSNQLSVIHTARINLSPFTKDFRVWVTFYEILLISFRTATFGQQSHN